LWNCMIPIDRLYSTLFSKVTHATRKETSTDLRDSRILFWNALIRGRAKSVTCVATYVTRNTHA
jgi:hypothetical protein